MRQSCLLIPIAAVVALAACGDNVDPMLNDAPVVVDADVAAPDARVDADPPDAGPNPSQQIGNALATPDGTGLALPIDGATVTYLKPQIGSLTNDPAGFTIQAALAGPALFVSVDPATLTPPAAVGDVVSFTITDMGTVIGQRRALAVTGYARVSTGANVGALAQDISAATDVATALDSYDSELIDVTATVATGFGFAGSGFESAQITTTGIPTADPNFRVRVPATLSDALDLVLGCTVALDNTPVGRFNTQAQLAAFVPADLIVSTCPAPTVVGAAALSATAVRLTFTRNILPASVVADGSQFTFDNSLTATAATVSGRTVDVTTTAQTGGTLYLATVAATVTDLQGVGVGTPNTATFSGFQVPATVRINEVNANIAGGCDLIELRVVAGGLLGGFRLQERDAGTLVQFSVGFTVATNDIIVVHMNAPSATCNPGGATQETSTVIDEPAAMFNGNYDTAYDWWSTDTGLTATDNVFTVYDATGAIHDAVFVDDNAGVTAAAATETQAAAVAAANQWQMVGGGVPAGGFVDADFIAHAAFDLDGAGATATGDTIQRLDDTDDNDKDDWNTTLITVQPQTWGLINAGQTAF